MAALRPDFWHKYGSYFIAALITLVAWSPVLVHRGFIMHGDLAYPTTLQNLQANYFPLWDRHPSISNFDEIDRVLIIQPLLWIARMLHAGVGIFSRFFPFLVSLCGGLGLVYSMRVLRTTVLHSDGPPCMAAEILAVVLFTLNPWALFRVEAPYYQMAYNFTPPFIALQLRYLSDGRIGYALAAAACWTLASGSPQYTIFAAVMSLVFLVLFHQSPGSPSWITLFFRYGAILVGYGIINLYWIGAFFDINKVSELTPGYTLRWEDVEGFSQNSTFFNVISGLDMWVVWWKPFNPFASGFYDSIANVLRPSTFVFACVAVLANYRKRFFQYAALILAALVLLLEGAHGPVAPLYKFLVFHLVPGYGWIIRAPEKFGAFLWIFYAWTIGLGLDQIAPRFAPLRTAIAATVASCVSLAAFFPVIYSTLLLHYIPIPIPDQYAQVWSALKDRPGEVLLLADYERLGQYNSGDAVFTWAPLNMAGSVAPRSFPLPTFAAYHFTNPFSYFYSFIKFNGAGSASGFAAIVGANYVALERDVEGDNAWYSEWKHALLQQHAHIILENSDFGIFKIPGIRVSEVRSGPYAVLAGDLNGILALAGRFGTQLYNRNLFLLEQLPASSVEKLVDKASLLLLDQRSLSDVANVTLTARYGVRLPTATGAKAYQHDWAAERLAYRFEMQGGFWGNVRTQINSNRWVLDNDQGVLATNAKGVAFRLSAPARRGTTDLLVRTYFWPRRAASAFHVTSGVGGTAYVEAFDAEPRWKWVKVATFKAGTPIDATVVNDYGLSMIGAAIAIPPGMTHVRETQLAKRFDGRIVTDLAHFDLRRWPSGHILSTNLPRPRDTFDADRSIVLNESYDPLWICRSRDADIESVPTWGFENGCAPMNGPMHFVFVPQQSVTKWLLIEGALVAIGAVLLALRSLLPRRRK